MKLVANSQKTLKPMILPHQKPINSLRNVKKVTKLRYAPSYLAGIEVVHFSTNDNALLKAKCAILAVKQIICRKLVKENAYNHLSKLSTVRTKQRNLYTYYSMPHLLMLKVQIQKVLCIR